MKQMGCVYVFLDQVARDDADGMPSVVVDGGEGDVGGATKCDRQLVQRPSDDVDVSDSFARCRYKDLVNAWKKHGTESGDLSFFTFPSLQVTFRNRNRPRKPKRVKTVSNITQNKHISLYLDLYSFGC